MYPLFAICPSTLFAMFKKIDLYVTSFLSHFRSSRIVPLRLICTLSELDSREFIDPSTHDRQRNGEMGGGKRGSRSTISRDNRYRSSSTWFKLAFDSFSARDTRYNPYMSLLDTSYSIMYIFEQWIEWSKQCTYVCKDNILLKINKY